MRQTYLYKMAGEIITGEPAESYSNHHMERGHAEVPGPDGRHGVLPVMDEEDAFMATRNVSGRRAA